MKYSDIIQIVKSVAKSIICPVSISNYLGNIDIFNSTNNLESNNIKNNNIYAEYENSNKEYNESVPLEDNSLYKNSNSYEDENSYDYNRNNGYCNKQQDPSSDSQGVIDSITKELTSVRLQQAIILSEIVGKPKSKTRKRRRF